MNKSLKNTQKLAFGGMMAALVFAATYLFKIPISITQGYIHLGDAFILLGAVLLTLIKNGMNQLGIPTEYQKLVTGAVIIIAVLIDRKSAKITR